jgi:YegS/Rv2252/BmrU family lipid kinase
VISKVLIVANPIAGQGNGRAAAKQIHFSLAAAEIEATVVLDLPTIDPQQLKSADAIVVIGGDGTLRAVAGRCLLARGRVAPLLPVPMGTANLMGKHLGIEFGRKDLGKRVVQSIQQESIRMLDAAEVNGQLFLLMAGVGIDAQIVHELDKVRRGPINVASYLLPAAMALTTYQYPPLTVSADEEEIFSSAPAMALVANIAEYGTGFPLAPHARADDGMLDICVIPVNSPADAVQKFLYAWAGEHLTIEGVVYARGKRIEIRSKEPAPIQIDGDPAGVTPAIINLLPIRVPFIVPA